ncbi:MAG: hypothetical protein C0394_08990 [Syntrophus sp. (in: bacteria)]|nr:hypothetical protein [Syntrophus sp. (in: bacteria)]
MKKQTAKKKDSDEKKGLEVISVKIGKGITATYKGLGGTFACFTDSCLRKQTLPGFHEKGLIAGVETKDTGIALCLSGKHSAIKLREVMDIALLNTGAYPEKRGKAKYSIEVKSEK